MDFLSPSEFLAVIVILVATAFDALRDAWMRSEGWWKRHIVKWVSFYMPLAYIMFTVVPWEWWSAVAIISWIVWRMSLRHIGGVQWESMWVRWAKTLFSRE